MRLENPHPEARTVERLRIAFLVGELTVGGAEMMLWKLISRLDRSRFEPVVIAFSPRTDFMLERFKAIDTTCFIIGMRSRVDLIGLARLNATIAKLKPHVLQGWMYYGNVVATLLAAIRRSPPITVWGVRGTLNLAQEKRLGAFTIWLTGKLSFAPARIINNSLASALEHEKQLGYSVCSRVVLPNGFDTNVFVPDATAKSTIRRELKIPPDAVLVGLIGRYHPMKDHETFVRAAARVQQGARNVFFLLAGESVDASNAKLVALLEDCGLERYARLLGLRQDMPAVMAALDIAVSASHAGEGFPNVLGEAMSCGVPCVATDVGDSAIIVGDTGKIVPPRSPEALAAAIDELIIDGAQERMRLGLRARERIVSNYSLEAVVRRYEHLYLTLVDARTSQA